MGTEARGRDIDALLSNIMTSINLDPGQSIDFDAFFELFNADDGILDKVHLQCQTNKSNPRPFSIYGLKKTKNTENPQQDQLSQAFEEDQDDTKTVR